MTSRIGRVAAHLSKMASKTPTDIHLYTAQTPNGIKASILLEELGLEYKVTHDDAARQSVWNFLFVLTDIARLQRSSLATMSRRRVTATVSLGCHSSGHGAVISDDACRSRGSSRSIPMAASLP